MHRRALLFPAALAVAALAGPSAHASTDPRDAVRYDFDGRTPFADVTGNGAGGRARV